MTELTYTEEVVPIEKITEDEEFKSLVPPNNSKEDLEKSLKEKSQIFPLITDKNYVVIDGYTRLDIMKKLGFKEVKILKYDFDSQQERDRAYELIWTFNGVRRQLDKNERLALFQKIADRIAKIQVSKNKTEESKIELHATQFSATESKQIEENEEFVTLDDGTTISAAEYKRILKELDKENKALSESDKHKMAILRINTPWLLKYVTDQKYKVPLDQAFRIYTRAKDLGILDKLKDLAPALRDPLISTREGRKIILNDEYRDLLEKIISKQYTTERAILEVKQKEALKRGGKVKKSSKPKAKEEDKDLDETEDEGEEVKTIEREHSESEEYDFVGEWQKVAEIEAKQQQTPQEETPPTRTEIYTPKADLDSLYKAMPSIKKLVDEGKLTEKDAEKVYEIWRNMEAIFKQASLLWYNTVDILLKRVGLSEEEREQIFYEMVKPYFRLFSREEVFPKEVLEGKL